MGFKPELLTTASSVAEAIQLVEAGADALTLGDARYGMRLAGSFSVADMIQVIASCGRPVRLYVSVNQIMSNDMLPQLGQYLSELEQAGVYAILFGDPAVLIAARTFAPNLRLHWNAEMTATNYVTANYWASKGASRAIAARELNMEQLLEWKRSSAIEIQVQVHGMTNIYHSKRSLVSSYRDHQHAGTEGLADSQQITDKDGKLFLIESERPNERYPIYEDESGTHIMSSDDICMIENIGELIDGGIDSFKIEGILRTTDELVTIVRCYREAIDCYCSDPDQFDAERWMELIREQQDPRRELSYGFFFKEQVY